MSRGFQDEYTHFRELYIGGAEDGRTLRPTWETTPEQEDFMHTFANRGKPAALAQLAAQQTTEYLDPVVTCVDELEVTSVEELERLWGRIDQSVATHCPDQYAHIQRVDEGKLRDAEILSLTVVERDVLSRLLENGSTFSDAIQTIRYERLES